MISAITRKETLMQRAYMLIIFFCAPARRSGKNAVITRWGPTRLVSRIREKSAVLKSSILLLGLCCCMAALLMRTSRPSDPSWPLISWAAFSTLLVSSTDAMMLTIRPLLRVIRSLNAVDGGLRVTAKILDTCDSGSSESCFVSSKPSPFPVPVIR